MEEMNTPSSPDHDRDSTVRQRDFQSVLSESEPTLRFPRPQGNRRLANWVSTSQPDIMHATDMQEEHSLLSDSTYEVIHNTDTESQDGFPSESVCSSDYPRSDDVHSLAGTEHMHDEQEDNNSESQDSEHEEDAYELHDGDVRGETQEEAKESADFEDLEATEPAPETPTHSEILERKVRTSSIQYAEESLEAPSAHTTAEEKKKPISEALINFFNNHPWRYRGVILYWSTCLLLTTFTAFAFFKLGPTQTQIAPISQPSPTTVYVSIKNPATTSTVIISHTSTKTILVSESKTASVLSATHTPLLGGYQTEKIPEAKGICSAEVHGRREILVKIPQGTKLSWLNKDAITIDVSRGQDLIKAKFSSVDEGILIEIPKREARGVLNVTVTTTRRPKVNETFEVDFGTDIFAQALGTGCDMVKDMSSKLVDSAWLAKADLEVRLTAAGVSFTEIKEQASQAWREAENMASKQTKWMLRIQGDVRQKQQELKVEAETALLRAQIAANLLWLQMQGKKAEHDLYYKKASEYMKLRVESLQRAKLEHRGKKRTGCKGFSLWAQE